MTDRQIQHRDNCTGVDTFTTTGHSGDNITRCKGCNRFAIENNPRDRPKDTPAPAAAPAPTFTTGYVCPEHWSPVRPNGKGCPACAHTREAARATRAARSPKWRADRPTTDAA